MTISAQVSDKPEGCGANYTIAFEVNNPPGGAVTITYTWHLPNGQNVTEKPVTLNTGTTPFTDFIRSGSMEGKVYATWTAVGSPSDSAPVTITCIT